MGKFELYQGKFKKATVWRWRLKARNGQIIAISEAYTSKRAAQRGINSVRLNAPLARVVEV